MRSPPPLVSVVIVTLNGRDLLAGCLEGLRLQDYPALQTIVVDNGSSEDIAGMVAVRAPGAAVIRLPANAGFAGGNNVGLRAAQGEYVALINNDAVPEPGWIRAMVEAAEADPGLGAVASVVIDGNAPTVLDSRGVGVALDGMSRQADQGLPSDSPVRDRERIAASGCACLLRASALRDSGLFDERFFAYCEDTDLCLRIRRAGWSIALAPDACVTHFYSRTSGATSLRKAFWVERNHYWVALKNYPLPLVLALPFTTLWRYGTMLALLFCRRAGQGGAFVESHGLPRLAGTLLRANVAALLGAPAMLAARWRFRPPGRVPAGRVLRMILRHRIPLRSILSGRAADPQPGGRP